jgi:hypothetical protein
MPKNPEDRYPKYFEDENVYNEQRERFRRKYDSFEIDYKKLEKIAEKWGLDIKGEEGDAYLGVYTPVNQIFADLHSETFFNLKRMNRWDTGYGPMYDRCGNTRYRINYLNHQLLDIKSWGKLYGRYVGEDDMDRLFMSDDPWSGNRVFQYEKKIILFDPLIRNDYEFEKCIATAIGKFKQLENEWRVNRIKNCGKEYEV